MNETAYRQGPPPPTPTKKPSTVTIVLVVIAGIGGVCCLAGVGVGLPAFRQYSQRAKTTEAVSRLAFLYRMSATYTAGLAGNPAGAAPQFPESVPLTPASVPHGARVVDAAGTWDAPTWRALGFAMQDPHYYSYQYDASGVGPGARFTARAVGDLDGDDVCSTFERAGALSPSLEVQGSPIVFSTRTLE